MCHYILQLSSFFLSSPQLLVSFVLYCSFVLYFVTFKVPIPIITFSFGIITLWLIPFLFCMIFYLFVFAYLYIYCVVTAKCDNGLAKSIYVNPSISSMWVQLRYTYFFYEQTKQFLFQKNYVWLLNQEKVSENPKNPDFVIRI